MYFISDLILLVKKVQNQIFIYLYIFIYSFIFTRYSNTHSEKSCGVELTLLFVPLNNALALINIKYKVI